MRAAGCVSLRKGSAATTPSTVRFFDILRR